MLDDFKGGEHQNVAQIEEYFEYVGLRWWT